MNYRERIERENKIKEYVSKYIDELVFVGDMSEGMKKIVSECIENYLDMMQEDKQNEIREIACKFMFDRCDEIPPFNFMGDVENCYDEWVVKKKLFT